MTRQTTFVFLIITLITGCNTYDYAVDKSKTDLAYRTYYYGDKNREFDFYTVLYFRVGEIGTAINYFDFNVHIAHMLYKHQHKYQGLYVSELVFDQMNKAKVIIDYSSLKLTHRDSSGNIIIPVKTESSPSHSNSHRNSYKLIYNPDTLPDLITESIYVELSVNGKHVVINASLPIEKTRHYSYWDMLMGV